MRMLFQVAWYKGRNVTVVARSLRTRIRPVRDERRETKGSGPSMDWVRKSVRTKLVSTASQGFDGRWDKRSEDIVPSRLLSEYGIPACVHENSP